MFETVSWQAPEFWRNRYRSERNSAFEEHRRETLDRLAREKRRLDEDQREFEEFLDELKRARDRESFDAFMRSRGGKD